MATVLLLWRWAATWLAQSPISGYRITTYAVAVVGARVLIHASLFVYETLTTFETSLTLRRCRNALFCARGNKSVFFPVPRDIIVVREVVRYWSCQRLALGAAAHRIFRPSKRGEYNVAKRIAASLTLPWWGLDPLLQRWLEGNIVYTIDEDAIRALLRRYLQHRPFRYRWMCWRNNVKSFERSDEAILCLGSLAIGSLLFSVGRSLDNGQVAEATVSLEEFHDFCRPLRAILGYGMNWRHDTARKLLHAFRVEFDFLWWRIKKERRRSVWALCRYLSNGAVEQAWALSAASICTILAGSVEATTIAIEGDVGILLLNLLCRSGPRGLAYSKNTNFRYIVSLLATQCVCATAASTLREAASLMVKGSCAFKRAQVKCNLFQALVAAPRAFLDRLSEDELEELLYSVNDMEGVELHLLNYATSLVRNAVSLYVVCCRNPTFPWASTTLTILLLQWIQWVSSEKTRLWLRWSNVTLSERSEDGMLSVEEEISGSAPLLLTGVDIVAQISLLRPLGADRRLMADWILLAFGKKKRKMHHFFLMRRLFGLLEECRVATAIIGTLIRTLSSSSVLDAAVVAWHGTLEGKSVSTLRHALQNTTRSVLETRRIVDLVVSHAYKAVALERTLASGRVISKGVTIVQIPRGHIGTLAVENVSFAYPNRPERIIFHCLTLHIPLSGKLEGGCLTVVKGRNGGGKSTLLKLIASAYEVCSGSITLSLPWKNIIDPESDASHTGIAYVPQHTTIFEGSVAENVAMKLRVTLTDVDVLRKVERVMHRVGLGRVLQTLPEGAMTKLAADGTLRGSDMRICLSGGEQQRLSIARALYDYDTTFPSLILLDEPTTSTDEAASCEVRELLIELARGCAVFCASHDTKLMEIATQVVVLDEMESQC